MHYTVEATWLKNHLQDESVRIIDCRFNLANAGYGEEAYQEEHIVNALYMHLERDLSGPIGTYGGRHPLPDLELFMDKLSDAGIDEDTTVVAYDSQHGAMASRLWWLLTYLGHKKVYVLNGGFLHWKQLNLPTTHQVPVFTRKNFIAYPQHDMLVQMQDIKKRIDGRSAFVLIDSREPNRYKGIEEPIDKKAGHIPTARNYFWKEGVTAEGMFHATSQQEARFADINKDEEVIVYCGSGVTACPNVLALKEAGFQNVKLYAGSWSDWISYEDNPIVQKQ
ncbi:sulfurtransferase [Ectobacillus antri]|jgi:thiosulfate/3-mercaptopyruvate sulfurtransferase|uniref:Sulfurtransferase n=1 Tax=Ectobacillus antri TaxID=2486280 RepID=A0ABT6H0S9_9BACI|nr:sulfurtransferase [Ectobacillus antri]MDG4656162.1 sulfurtransferase [Ectobacillus antri]MDG5752837.1 sulfurtransferase [Ectobacillus antri]